jgi:CheY-like chemotaxis protein
MMPDMNGFEVIQRMNAMTLDAPPQVILLASSENAGDRGASRDLDVSGYIMKPFTKDTILEKLAMIGLSPD